MRSFTLAAFLPFALYVFCSDCSVHWRSVLKGTRKQYVMRQLPTYWYQTDLFWKEYPHWRMIPELKVYYLLELSYWIQQMLVLVLRLEKPRSDYYELIVHVRRKTGQGLKCGLSSLSLISSPSPARRHAVARRLELWHQPDSDRHVHLLHHGLFRHLACCAFD